MSSETSSLTLGLEQSPRDDLESLGYMMIYFMQGKLLWQGLKAQSKQEKERMVMESKAALKIEELCTGLPSEFADYMKYVESLSHGEMPDYEMLKRIFRGLASKELIHYDNVFDWTVRLYLSRLDSRESIPATG